MTGDLDDFERFYESCAEVCTKRGIATDELTQRYRELRTRYCLHFPTDRWLTSLERQEWAALLEQAAVDGWLSRDLRICAAAKFAKRHSEFVRQRKDL